MVMAKNDSQVLKMAAQRDRSERLKMVLPSLLSIFFQGVAWLGPQLRTSNDHCFIVGVP